MSSLVEWMVALLLFIGAFFIVISGIGLVRLPDLFMRLHAPTKASTLGMGCLLLASMLFAAQHGRFGLAELLITLLAFITAPVSANLLAQAAIHLNLRSRSGKIPERLNRRLPSQTTASVRQQTDSHNTQ